MDGEVRIGTKIDTSGLAKDSVKLKKNLMTTFASMRDIMMGPIGAINMLKNGLTGLFKTVDQYEKAWAVQEEALALLDSTLKATGASAWTSKDQLTAFASKMQSVTKYGDETTLAMTNVLLGFKNIKGDNFYEASKQILNMATVMKMDLTSAAQAVGKALDDPIAGIDSLSKQGFRFSQEQKETLKVMVQTGDIAKAQKIILDELATTYGGAAEAAGMTSSAIKVRLSNALGDSSEAIGKYLTNYLTPARLTFLGIVEGINKTIEAANGVKSLDKIWDFDSTKTEAENLEQLARAQALATQARKTAFMSSKNAETAAEYEKKLKMLKEDIEYQKIYLAGTELLAKAQEKDTAETERKTKASELEAANRKIIMDLVEKEKSEYDKLYELIQKLSALKINDIKTDKERNKLLEEYKKMLAELQPPDLAKGLSLGSTGDAPIGNEMPALPGLGVKLPTLDNSSILGFNATEALEMATKVGLMIPTNIASGINIKMLMVSTAAKLLMKNIKEIIQKGLAFIKKTISTGMNILNGLAKFDPAAMYKSLEELLKGVMQFFKEDLPQMSVWFDAGLKLIEDFLSGMVEMLPDIILWIGNAITSMANMVISRAPAMIEAGFQIITALVLALLEQLPVLVQTAFTLFLALVQGLIQAIPVLLPAIALAIADIILVIVDNIPAILDGAIALFMALVDALPIVLPILVEAIIKAIPLIVEAIIMAIPEIILALLNAIPVLIETCILLGVAIIRGLLDGMASTNLFDELVKFFTDLGKVIQDIFSFGSGMGAMLIDDFFGGIKKALKGADNELGKFGKSVKKFFGFADGTNFAPGGMAIVGERGPELIDLPRGSKVFTNQETMSMFNRQSMPGVAPMAMASGQSQPIYVSFKMDGAVNLDGNQLGNVVFQKIDYLVRQAYGR